MMAEKKKCVHLPEELITEILLRSPVKILLRCRCVCKSWCSLISDPQFASSHFQLTAPTNPKLFFIDSNANKALSIDFNASLNDDFSFSSGSLAFLRPYSHPRFGGSCRGFLLLHSYADIYIWNPSTGFHKRIPISPLTIVFSNHNFIKLLYGFAYDPSMNDYFVVFGSYQLKNTYLPVYSSIKLEIFSLRANNWKQILVDSHLPYRATATSNSDENASPIAGLFLNGSIHWLVYNYETEKNVIIAFDLKEMTMLEIALPNQFYTDSSFNKIDYDFFVFGGLISAWRADMYRCEMWVMQEYAVDSSWTKTLDFSFYHVPTFSPICFTNCGHIVGLTSGGLVKYNDKGKLQEIRSYRDFHFARSKMTVYTESLLSL